MQMELWVQRWEETERGWGTRPDGYTLHQRREDIQAFEKEMRDREALAGFSSTNVPDEYTRVDGQPYLAVIDDEDIIRKVTHATHGIWGPNGNNCPDPA